MIVTANAAEGANHPYGYNLLSERSIADIQLFAAFVLRHSTMQMAKNSFALTLFSDAESARTQKVLMNGFFCVIDGYAQPLPINFCQGGIRTTGKHLFEALKHGITADNYLDGKQELFAELADLDGDGNDSEVKVKQGREKLARLSQTHELGMP